MAEQRKMEYVISYEGAVRSYFKGWTSPVQIPQFGAKIHETPRFATEREANAEISRMPFTASISCSIKPVMARKTRRAK